MQSFKIDAFILLASSENPILISLLCVELIDPFILFWFPTSQSLLQLCGENKHQGDSNSSSDSFVSALHKFRFGLAS